MKDREKACQLTLLELNSPNLERYVSGKTCPAAEPTGTLAKVWAHKLKNTPKEGGKLKQVLP